MPQTTSVGDWIDEVKDSTVFKAISWAIDSASYLSSAYGTLKSVFCPEPSTADLIQQALEQIVREFRDGRAEDLAHEVDGLSTSYARYFSTRIEGLLANIISDLNNCQSSMEPLIAGSDARSAFLVAKAYNLAIPLNVTVALQAALYQQLYGDEKPIWSLVHQQNQQLLQYAVTLNAQLLGPPVFEGEDRLALWRYTQGKLFAGAPDIPSCRRVTETVWRANEGMRELLIPDLPATWFTVRSALSATYLTGDPETGEVRGVSDRPPDRNALWRLDQVSHETVRLVHISERCLSVIPTGGSERDPYSRVRLLPGDAGGGEYDYQVFVVELSHLQDGRPQHYVRRWHDGAWQRVGAAIGVIGSAPAAFLNRAPQSLFHAELFGRVDDQVSHFWRGARDQVWHLGATFGHAIRSAPAAFQNQAAASEFNYEVFVVEDGTVAHYWRSWHDGAWRRAATIGANVSFGPAAFQNVLWNSMFNYELLVVEGGAVQHYWRDWNDGRWHKASRFGSGVQSGPAAFQNSANGNHEVFVVENGKVQHYWREADEGRWRKGAAFGTDVRSAPAAFQNCAAEALFNYEVFVIEGSQVQHYWRGWQDGAWHTGARFGEKAFGVAATQTVDFRDNQLLTWQDVTEPRRKPSVAVELLARGHLLLRSGDVWTKRLTHIGERQDSADALAFEASALAPAVERFSLEPLTAPECFVRHQEFRVKISAVVSDLDRQDATFRLMPGLASGLAISFEAVNYPGYFLRHRNFELVLEARGMDALFRLDATFRRRPGLADRALLSFESENWPGHFLRHRSGLLYLERGEGTAFARDATFRLLPPRWTAQ